jgi:hypothetical protein
MHPRLISPLPLDYIPAYMDFFLVTTKTSSFTSTTPEALAKVATMIRSNNNNWSEKVFRDILKVVQIYPMNPGLVPEGPLDTLVTDHIYLSSVILED